MQSAMTIRPGLADSASGTYPVLDACLVAVLNTLALSLMDQHREALVARQIRRFASYPDEALGRVVRL
jgi:hypothetical protein